MVLGEGYFSPLISLPCERKNTPNDFTELNRDGIGGSVKIVSGSRLRMPSEPKTVMEEGKENEWAQIQDALRDYNS